MNLAEAVEPLWSFPKKDGDSDKRHAVTAVKYLKYFMKFKNNMSKNHSI